MPGRLSRTPRDPTRRSPELFATCTQAAGAKKFLDFFVVAQEKDEELFGSVFKQEPQGQVASTLEKPVAELADANSAAAMRLTEGVDQLNEGQHAFDPVALFKLLELLQDVWIKSEELLQAAL